MDSTLNPNGAPAPQVTSTPLSNPTIANPAVSAPKFAKKRSGFFTKKPVVTPAAPSSEPAKP